MDESILIEIKKLLGLTEDYIAFDKDIIIYINTAFAALYQLGIGPAAGFRIEDSSSVWGDFITDEKKLGLVQSYVYIKVKMIFDPPASSIVMDAINRAAGEYEWRLKESIDYYGM